MKPPTKWHFHALTFTFALLIVVSIRREVFRTAFMSSLPGTVLFSSQVWAQEIEMSIKMSSTIKRPKLPIFNHNRQTALTAGIMILFTTLLRSVACCGGTQPNVGNCENHTLNMFTFYRITQRGSYTVTAGFKPIWEWAGQKPSHTEFSIQPMQKKTIRLLGAFFLQWSPCWNEPVAILSAVFNSPTLSCFVLSNARNWVRDPCRTSLRWTSHKKGRKPTYCNLLPVLGITRYTYMASGDVVFCLHWMCLNAGWCLAFPPAAWLGLW